MSYRFYTQYPVADFIQSFVDSIDPAQNQTAGADCEGGACGPRGGHHGFRGRGGYGPGGRHHWRSHPHHHQQQSETSDVIKPQVDIYSTETDYKVYVALPSADKESIELTY